MKRIQKINERGFTLFELMVSMAIFGLLMITVLQTVASIGISRTKSMTRITLLEELYFFSEKLATSIKEGGIIDYEEYWNRLMVGTTIGSGYYSIPTGFGNYGSGGVIGGTNYGLGYYYCRSQDSSNKVGTGGCIDAAVNTSTTNQLGVYQRYGQYAIQYFDYNGNWDADLGDEDGNGNIRGDDDDKDIGDGPDVIMTNSTPELYLINPVTNERLYFRWTYAPDPGLPPSACNMTNGSGCLGNIEMLRLIGKDIGLSHTGGTIGIGSYDGAIDTWICHPDWTCNGPTLPAQVGGGSLPTGSSAEWVKMFPDYVNVRSLSFSIYPRENPWKSWAALDDLVTPGFVSPFIQPYVRVQMTLGLSWEKRRLIRGDDPTIAISTTINLSNISSE